MHSLIIAREGNENDSDNQSLIKNTTELVDDTHHLLSEQISSVSDELDSFFGEERMDGDFNKSKIRLNFITTFDDEGKATYKTNISISLILPRTQKKMNLIVEDVKENLTDDDQSDTGGSQKQNKVTDTVTESTLTAALQYVIFDSKTWTIDMVTVNSTSISADITLDWNDGDELTDFLNTDCRIIRHNGTVWDAEQDWGGSGTIRTVTGITTFSPFGLERRGPSGGPLPIELLSFAASMVDKTRVELKWVTTSEINNEYFTVERSSNGLNFEEIAEVTGAGNSNDRLEYNTYDDDPLEGISYYRLKQTDYDGQFEYFKMVAVSYELNADGSCVLKVFPNPCIGRCTVNLSECEHNENADIKVEMIDAAGNLVYSKIPFREFDGSFQFNIDSGNNLKPGVYIIRGTSTSESYHKKVIIK